MPDALYADCRVEQPMVRKGWLEEGPGVASARRGADPFVTVDWDKAVDLVTDELTRVKDTFGNNAIFGGSYGWSSAGRFHHAQTQLKRFLGCIGGFRNSFGSYSNAAGQVILRISSGLAPGPDTDRIHPGTVSKHQQNYLFLSVALVSRTPKSNPGAWESTQLTSGYRA